MTSPVALAEVPRLSRSPFASPARLGAELVVLFEQVRPRADKVQWVQRHITDELAGPRDEALDRACAAVAAAIDAEAAVFDRPQYHNRQHFCEVALTAHVLCGVNRLDVRTTQFLLLAALIHDFAHEGGAYAAFVQERSSVEQVRPVLEAAGLDTWTINRLQVLVLATDVACGLAFMAAACRAHDRGAAVTEPVPEGAPELGALIADAELARLARILCEADILPSVGLDAGHAMLLQERLSREWRRPLDPGDKLKFIDFVLRQGFVGDFFLPNVRATRAAVAGRLHAFAER